MMIFPERIRKRPWLEWATGLIATCFLRRTTVPPSPENARLSHTKTRAPATAWIARLLSLLPRNPSDIP